MDKKASIVDEPEGLEPATEVIDLKHEMVRLFREKQTTKRSAYSFSLLASITNDKVLSAQLIEGGVDAPIFENFLFKTLHRLRTDKQTSGSHIVILMDNASIHKH